MQSIVGTYVGSISLLQDWTGIGSNPIRPPPLFSYLFLEDGIRPNFAVITALFFVFKICFMLKLEGHTSNVYLDITHIPCKYLLADCT